MAPMLRRCGACGRYSTARQCPSCSSPTVGAHPPKFSFPDKYGEYRRKAKQRTTQP
ncbi:MAG: nucleolar RNA-binding Nop10p family protein [Candidatus Aenigmarchaeota archaeon]|nr:nucleolar RNA-binding Nop10p family protein [Candidatus Aenigmarchaeota archaeon]